MKYLILFLLSLLVVGCDGNNGNSADPSLPIDNVNSTRYFDIGPFPACTALPEGYYAQAYEYDNNTIFLYYNEADCLTGNNLVAIVSSIDRTFDFPPFDSVNEFWLTENMQLLISADRQSLLNGVWVYVETK